MGRYKEKDKTTIAEMFPPLPTSNFEIEDTKTGKVGKGTGFTKEEARKNAWEDLKYGKESEEKETTKTSSPSFSGGGGGGGGGGLGGLGAGIAGFFFILVCIFATLDLITTTVETEVLKKMWPTYETSAEKSRRLIAESKRGSLDALKSEWKVPWAPELKPWESYDGSDALRDFGWKNKNPGPQAEDGLKNLAIKIRKNGGWCVTVRDYCQLENNIWAVGDYSNFGGGFICYSPNKGTTWYKQWKSNPGNTDGIPFGVYFFDAKEGWAFTRKGILHTFNGGNRWDWSCRNEGWFLRQLHIIDRKRIIAEDIPDGRMIYTLNGGRNWRVHPKWEPEILELEVKLKIKNESGLYVYKQIN